MENIFSESAYNELIRRLFCRFPSFQNAGAGAYKPGIANMEFADQLMGHPHRKYRIIHVAGTNGKGSVSNMLASVLSSTGLKVGLYTSPHIVDFRERIRICQPGPGVGPSYSMISKESVWSFVNRWHETFDHLDLSFFEITTLMALDWFAAEHADVVVLETGLGGRLDSTNIVMPMLSVITNIGLDHCDMLGGTLPEIAFEKAGIIKPMVPVVVGESHAETMPVFERKVLYTNLSEPAFMGNRTAIMSLLTFADRTDPSLWDQHAEILDGMDLKGEYQSRNLRTALTALDVLFPLLKKEFACIPEAGPERESVVRDAIVHTASRAGFRGRWEKLSDDPYVICDIGHNEHGLKYNFAQLSRMKSSGECTDLIIVYGSVADKDVGSVMGLMPDGAVYVFTQADSKRALPADSIRERYMKHCSDVGRAAGEVYVVSKVSDAVSLACRIASERKRKTPYSRPLIYIGGSTYVVSEAISCFE